MSEPPITITITGDWRVYEAACTTFQLEQSEGDPWAATPQANGSTIVTPRGSISFVGNDKQVTIIATPAGLGDVAFWDKVVEKLEVMAERASALRKPPWRKRTFDEALARFYRTRAAGGKITLKQLAEQLDMNYGTLRKRKMEYDARLGHTSENKKRNKEV